jgi:flagellar motor switch protein FliN
MENKTLNLKNKYIPMRLTVEIGNSIINLRDLKDLTEGAVIELNKEYHEQFLLKLNGVPVAKGEIVVIDNNIGFRIEEILSEEQIDIMKEKTEFIPLMDSDIKIQEN